MANPALEKACKKIQKICEESNGRSQVFYSGSHGHTSCIRHYFASSAQDASFSVEPGSAEDLSKIMKVIKDSDNSVKFAVKGGGHTSNPTFSSTKDIQISMSRFTKISHDETKMELTVGAGCLSDEIYKFIRAKERNIVGGGGSVGFAGWILGGGYSLKTSNYGLGIDNLVQAQIVIPNGENDPLPVKATEDINSDLFWAIKGGGNNFGIATEFVLKTHSQGRYIYGGLLTFDKPHFKSVKKAIVKFMERKDPQAAIVATFGFYRNQGKQEFKSTVLAFYDDEQPPPESPESPGLFNEFLHIPHHCELGKSSYNDPSEPHSETAHGPFPGSAVPGIGVMNARARWGTVMVSKYTPKLIDFIEEETKAAVLLMEKYNGKMVVAEIRPYLDNMVKSSVDSAWPHNGTEANGPLLVYFVWEGTENDSVWINQLKTTLGHIHDIALEEICIPVTDDAPVYCNMALEDFTSPEQIYRHNLADLSALRTKYDPNDVMGRTGGFRIPLGRAIVSGTYEITNTKVKVGIGVERPSGGRIVKSDGTTVDRFKISSGNGTEYTISMDSDKGNLIDEDGPGNVVCRMPPPFVPVTWRIIPGSRRNNQLEYSIVNRHGDKRWALEETQVKCIDVVGGPVPDEALWRFNKLT